MLHNETFDLNEPHARQSASLSRSHPSPCLCGSVRHPGLEDQNCVGFNDSVKRRCELSNVSIRRGCIDFSSEEMG